MTGPLDEQDDSATPLSEEEKEGLIPSYITLRPELNEAEQANILEAEDWAFTRKRKIHDGRRRAGSRCSVRALCPYQQGSHFPS